MRSAISVAIYLALAPFALMAQQAAPPPVTSAAPDPILDTANSYVGRALFLRCFCAENNITFDAQGKPPSAIKTTDWTLSAFNLQKVERKTPGTLELEGLRVVIKYIPDRHEFERHPQNDEKIKISVPEAADAAHMDLTMAAVFAVGIDLPLQRSMPDYWRHYFDPKTAWPQDDLTGQNVYIISNLVKGGPTIAPTVAHRSDPSYTNQAQHDRVRGPVQLRMIVDAKGEPRRVTVAQPLGYGLDEKAVEAMAKFRFTPATSNGAPVPALVLLQEDFAPATQPPH